MEQPIQNIIYLIDGSGFIYRAYHAIRGLSTSSGTPTNAVFGFTKMLIKLIDDYHPEYACMVFDAKGPTFRHELYNEYKANRPPMPEDLVLQLPLIKKIVAGFNFPTIELSGFEADDLIGTLAKKAEVDGLSVVIVSGDKDLFQLVTPKTTVWDPMKDKTINLETLKESHGVEPSQLIDVMGLSGDTSDNVPGVPGIGPKTALSLIKQFESIDRIYAGIDTITKKKQKQNLLEFKDQAYLSKKLVTIDVDVPVTFEIEKYKIPQPDKKVLHQIYQELEFRQLVQSHPQDIHSTTKNYRLISTVGQLKDLVEKLNQKSCFAIDTETTSANPMLAKLVGISISYEPNSAFYIPCGHDDPNLEQLNLVELKEGLSPVLKNQQIKKIGQNIKYDWMVLKRHGIDLAGPFFDTMVASYLINPSKRQHGLDQLALDHLNYKTISFEEIVGKGKNQILFSAVPIDKALMYAGEDADITLQLFTILHEKLNELNLIQLFEQVEEPLIAVLMEMELTGIKVDHERLKQLSHDFNQQLISLEEDIYQIAGEKFNIKSSQQLGTILFEKLNLPVVKKTKKKTGYSTDVEVLNTLAPKHRLPALILRHRTLSKLKSTYTDALIELIHPETQRVHTSYNQTVTATGRLSSSDPNLQNIPIRSKEGIEIRKAFIARNGWQLVSADYSQIELRILAHYAEDEVLLESFAKDEDIHNRTAMDVFQVSSAFITKEIRRQAKAINFGIIYGMSPYGLSRELGISQSMAKNYIQSYFRRYQGVKRFMEQTIELVKNKGYTSTLLDRIRILPEINNSNRNIRENAERIAINTPIQGTAADLIKLAMLKMAKALKKNQLKTAMLLSVHDELVFEVPKDELDVVLPLVQTTLEGVWELKVPLKVNLDQGNNWAEAH